MADTEPIGQLRVGDTWGDGPGDRRVRVHRVDPANDRAQFRMAEDAGKGMRWALNRVLKRGATVKLRKLLRQEDGVRYGVALSATVLTAQQNGVTLGGFQYTEWDAPAPDEREQKGYR